MNDKLIIIIIIISIVLSDHLTSVTSPILRVQLMMTKLLFGDLEIV